MKRQKLESAIIAIISSKYKEIEKNFITEDLFRNLTNIKIFRKIMELGENSSIVTIGSRLAEDELIYFSKLFDDNFEVLLYDLPIFIKEIKRLDKIDKIKTLLEKFDETPIDSIINQLHELDDKIQTERPTFSATELSKQLYSKLERISQTPDQLTGVTSGIEKIDNFLWGFQPATVYILAGRPSMGKGILVANIALNAANSGKRVYLQALEESSDSIITRMCARETQLNNENLNKGKIKNDDWEKIVGGINRLAKDNLLINDSTGLTSTQIMRLVKKEHTKKPIDILIVDHIQEIRDVGENRRLEVMLAASNLRALAKSLNIPVIIVSQLNRALEMRQDKRPLLSDLRESGDLEQIADAVIFLFRPHYYNGETSSETQPLELIFAKNRNGRTGKITAGINLPFMSVHDDFDYTEIEKPLKF